MKRLYFVIMSALLFTACDTESHINKTTVKHVDLERYLGRWYEIARYEHHFEKNLEGVTAEYSMMDDGMIRVKNSGYLDSLGGRYKEIIGKARERKNADGDGQLEVSFFWIFYSDYNILELDTINYSYALVGSRSSDYLWILSRTPKMKTEDLNFLLSKIESRGYSIDNLYWVKQPER